MSDKVRWGVLGVASIATRKVIRAMQQGERSQIVAIASRDHAKARSAAAEFRIDRAYGSYEELLRDADVEAIYNPLPNHEHVPWSIRSAEAGKHVLCEKPIALNAAECWRLIGVRDRTGVKIGEAFMVRTHPQWLRARELVRSGAIGAVRSIITVFSYFNRDPQNVRHVPEWGGGGLLDIGCYAIQISRFILGVEPLRAIGLIERDPDFGVDRLTSALLDFPSAQSVFTCSMQMVPAQRVNIFGTGGRIEIEIPFNAPPDRPCRIYIDNGADVLGSGIRLEEIAISNQYTIQGDLFSRAIREGTEVPTPLEDSLRNMAVIDAIFQSAETRQWERPESFVMAAEVA